MSFADHEELHRELSAPRGEQAGAQVSQTLEHPPTFRELREILRALRALVAGILDKWKKRRGRKTEATGEARGPALDDRP
jgi:hypothetical protein